MRSKYSVQGTIAAYTVLSLKAWARNQEKWGWEVWEVQIGYLQADSCNPKLSLGSFCTSHKCIGFLSYCEWCIQVLFPILPWWKESAEVVEKVQCWDSLFGKPDTILFWIIQVLWLQDSMIRFVWKILTLVEIFRNTSNLYVL